MKFAFCSIAIFLLAIGCASGQSSEKKSVLNNLNGENYDVGPNGPAETIFVPVVKSKQRESTVSGEVRVSSGIAPIPLRYVAVQLADSNGRLMAQATSDSDGKFHLHGVFDNGYYQLKIASGKYSGYVPVTIKDYVTDGIVLNAEQAPPESR